MSKSKPLPFVHKSLTSDPRLWPSFGGKIRMQNSSSAIQPYEIVKVMPWHSQFGSALVIASLIGVVW
jgi:hypothetical protein